MNDYLAEQLSFQPACDASTGKIGRWLKEWLARRQEARARRQHEKFLASLDPEILRDIGVLHAPSRPTLPKFAAYNPHLIAVTAIGAKSR